MERIFGRPIVTQEQMRARIRELGKQITTDYAGKDFVLVGVLKGAYAFYADLARAIRIPMRVDFLMVRSDGSRAKTSGKVKVVTELTEDIKGKDVLLVEDIVDSGLTAQYLIKTLAKKKPRSIKVCTLLSKPDHRTINVTIDYVGFKIPNKYVVGYGLDYQQKYRNLPYLAVLDIEEDLAAGLFLQVGFQFVNLGALASDDDARPRRADADTKLVGHAVNLYAGDAGGAQPVLQSALQLQIFMQPCAVIALSEPAGLPGLVVPQPKPVWMDFLSHKTPSE